MLSHLMDIILKLSDNSLDTLAEIYLASDSIFPLSLILWVMLENSVQVKCIFHKKINEMSRYLPCTKLT